MLLALSGKLAGARVLEGRFFVQQIALAVPKGRASAVEYGRALVERAKTRGLVQNAITGAGLRGVTVAVSASIK